MPDPGIDVPPALTTGTNQHSAPSSSSSRLSGPGSPRSLLGDWENWPENDPGFDPVFDSAWPLRPAFCKYKGPDCDICSESRQVFHVSEYTGDGRRVMDRKVNTTELHEHLQELERLDGLDTKIPDHPSVRLFFACGNYGSDSTRFSYMRHFLAYCRIPPHFILKLDANDCLPVFQAAYEPKRAENAPSEPQRGILHIYLQCLCFVAGTDIIANARYYSTEFEPHIRKWAKGAGFSALNPTLYIRYDETSRDGEVYVADSAKTFHSLHDIFSGGVRGANRDPFLLVAVFLQHRLAELHEYVSARRTTIDRALRRAKQLTSLDSDAADLFFQFDRLAEGKDDARLGHEISSMLRALRVIEAEHLLFLERDGDAACRGDAANIIRLRFQRQRAQLLELESAFAELLKIIEIVKDLMIGRAQLLNGIDMAKMTKDNQKQAAATEALALDARRDSEIMKRHSATMKTITVVTLVYLPATFVSTLLSMGLFDFGIGAGGNGHLRIAREGWVFFVISLPLTLLTLGLAFLWNQSKERQWALEGVDTKWEQEIFKQAMERMRPKHQPVTLRQRRAGGV